MGYFAYTTAIQQAIQQSRHRGKVEVRYNRKKYELSLKDARLMAGVLWGYTARTSHRLDQESGEPIMGLTFDRSRTLRDAGMVDDNDIFTERGVAAAETAFAVLTGFDLDECAAEVVRLRKLSEDRRTDLLRRRREGFGAIHDAEGRLIGPHSRLNLTEEDMAVIADQIAALRNR